MSSYEKSKKALADWLQHRGIKCPACGGDAIDAKGQINIAPSVHNGRVMMPDDWAKLGFPGAPSLPTIAAVCNDCGFVLQFSAIKVGVAEKT